MHSRGVRGSARAFRRQETYERLVAINAHRLWLDGCAIHAIALRASTSPFIVRQWLQEAADLAKSTS
jgi:hypothetical protein